MRMTERVTTRIVARSYEVDANGHIAGTVLLQYSQHARWECLHAAGVDQRALIDAGLGPVSLEERIRFHREVRAGDVIEVSCSYIWGDGKTFRVEQELRGADGTLIAEVTNTGGLLDLAQRRLVGDPADRWRSIASVPTLLGL
jgi:acyl-CoA thioester hydrolase